MPELVLKDSEFQKFSSFVSDMAGINLHQGKKKLLKARLGKIIQQRNFCSFQEYYDHVVHDKSGNELTILLNSISTNLTHFFREPKHFDFLRKRALPEIIKKKHASGDFRIGFWSAGCSSGEEAYSIAITASEAIDHVEKLRISILATDLSTRVLETARTGIYEKEKIDALPHELKSRYFQKGHGKWEGYFRVKKMIREKTHFRRLNLMDECHFSEPFDVIFCRNVMIYFDKPTKEVLVEKFDQNLARGGYFFLGHSESLAGIKHRLKYIQPSVYRKI